MELMCSFRMASGTASAVYSSITPFTGLYLPSHDVFLLHCAVCLQPQQIFDYHTRVHRDSHYSTEALVSTWCVCGPTNLVVFFSSLCSSRFSGILLWAFFTLTLDLWYITPVCLCSKEENSAPSSDLKSMAPIRICQFITPHWGI